MPEPSPESQQRPDRPAENGGRRVWVRLRECMEEMAASRTAKIEPDKLAQKLAARAMALRRRMDAKAAAREDCTLVFFKKGQQRYGIPIEDILEIHSLDQFVPVPGAARFIPGVIHWRGMILTLLDLERLFGVAEAGLADLRVCLVVEAAETKIAIVASEIEDIVSVSVDSLKPAPDLPRDIPHAWVVGVHDVNRLILCMHELLRDPKLVDFRRQKPRGFA
jgi:purine-binding chemotaxis protein CheW